MPLVKHIQINETCQLVLWEISEELDDLLSIVSLNESEQIRLDGFGSMARKKEFAVTRILLQELLGSAVFIRNNEHGKPSLEHSDFDISISHSKNYVGLMIGTGHELALDIEYLSDRVYSITKRFMSESEMALISEDEEQLHIYQHWCAKECLIKLYGEKDVHLIDELKIHPFNPSQSQFSGEVTRTDFSRTYSFKYELFNTYLMVWCCQKRN